jgi:hypothetical protein
MTCRTITLSSLAADADHHRISTATDTHLLPGTEALNMLDRSQKGRHANASTFRWRGVGRAQFRARSVELRTALLEHGWNEPIIRPLLTGIDPEAPTLF